MDKPLIYLDYQSSTPVDPIVVEAMYPYFSKYYFNPSSKNYYCKKISDKIEECRNTISAIINCNNSELLFTSGATESINLGIKGYMSVLGKGKIIVLKTEHSAVLETCRSLEKDGFCVNYLGVENNGLINLTTLRTAITEDVKLVIVMHVNNEIGTIQPIKEIGKICKESNIPLFVDAAQSFGKLDVDVKKFNISMLSISGHKIYGPKGIGALYISKELTYNIMPQINGGGQENGLRSGTLNVPGIVGLSKAAEISVEQIVEEQERILKQRNLLLNLIHEKISDYTINGNLEKRIAGNLNISFERVSGDVLFNNLENIIVSRGSACNSFKNKGSYVLRAIGLPDSLVDSAIRISLGRFTTEEEITQAAEILSSSVNKIRLISKLR